MTEPREPFDEQVRASYLRPQARDADAEHAALARLARAPAPARGLFAALFAPRRVTMRPALAGAAAAALLVGGALLGAGLSHRALPAPHAAPVATAPATASAPPADGTVPVVFALCTPGASRVTVAGDFNGWDANATPLVRAGGDVWMVRLHVPRGVHLYSFVLDGSEWRPDPSAPLAAHAVFGARNSVLIAEGSAAL